MDDELVERVALAIKAEMGRQLKATPAPGLPADSGDWTAECGTLDLSSIAAAALDAAKAK